MGGKLHLIVSSLFRLPSIFMEYSPVKRLNTTADLYTSANIFVLAVGLTTVKIDNKDKILEQLISLGITPSKPGKTDIAIE